MAKDKVVKDRPRREAPGGKKAPRACRRGGVPRGASGTQFQTQAED